MKIAKDRAGSQIFLLIIIIIGISIIVTILNPKFIEPNNIKNIFVQISIVSIMALGAGIVIISGGLDISVGSMVSMLAVICASLINNGISVALSIAITFAVAAGCGFLNGILAAKTKVSPFILTLGTMSIFSGLSLVVGKGHSWPLMGKFQFLGRARILGIHFPTYVMAITFVLIFIVLRYTRTGRRFYGIGGSQEVAFLAGVNVITSKVLVYIINALLVCLAALILVSRTGSALSTSGSGLELRAIAAAIIGGTSLLGGRGRVFGIFLGSLMLGVISNMLNILNLSAHYQSIILGLVIVIAVTIGRKR
jgi:ribose transport system permease protein